MRRPSNYRSIRAPGKRLGKHALAAICASAALCAAAIFSWQGSLAPAPEGDYLAAPAMPSVATSQAAVAQPVARPAARRVYPFSVVPGGVSGRDELLQVIKRDKVVAQHYAGFAAAQARAVTVAKPRAVYVSYRKGDQVYWTAKKVMLAEGETLLTDGSNEMRARCANRISDTPQLPVETEGPTEEELDFSVMQVSSEDAGDEGLPYSHTLQTFAASGGAAGETAPDWGMDAPSAAPAIPTTLSTISASSSTSTGDRPAPDNTSGGTGSDDTSSTGTPPGGATGGETPDGTDTTTPAGPGGGTSSPEGGTPPTGGSSEPGGTSPPGGGTPPSKPPVETVDPPPETSPDITPLIPEPGSPPPIPGRGGEDETGLADVPEPGSLWLSALGLAALLLLRRKAWRGRALD